MKEKLIIECEEVEQAAWWKTFRYLKEGWKAHPFEIQIGYPFGFRNPFCNVFYRKPRTLRGVGIERFLHRQVLGWGDYLGSYGMGGPGFFGFSLSKTRDYRRECLVLTLRSAIDWILFDEKPLFRDRRRDRLIKYYIESGGKPIYSGYDEDGKELYTSPDQPNEARNYIEDNVDEFTLAIVGSELVSISLKQDYSKFEFLQNGKYHKLETPGDPDELPRYTNLEERVWDTDEHIGDAWVVSRVANLKL